ncbi:hypothetical protein FBZ91_102209 [Nitrospirillum viridazoti]|nr:hypothetical protein FBZ91_102209 [Nitrospirillum amazonense]
MFTPSGPSADYPFQEMAAVCYGSYDIIYGGYSSPLCILDIVPLVTKSLAPEKGLD